MPRQETSHRSHPNPFHRLIHRKLLATYIGLTRCLFAAILVLGLVVAPALADGDPDRVLLRCTLDVIDAGVGGGPDTTECVESALRGSHPEFDPLTATVHGDPQPVSGRYPSSTSDKALAFDGDGDYLTLTGMPTLDGAASFTVEAWIWAESPSVNVFRIQQPVTLGTNKFQVLDTDGGAGWTTLYTSGQAAPTSTWYHLAGVFDQRELRIYVDGRLSEIAIVDFEAATSGGSGYSTWAIGARVLSGSADQEFEGRIDEVSVYAEALPSGTIFRHARDRETQPVSELNVRTYSTTPAVGDGVTDDTSALQAVLDAAATSGANVFLPSGTYRISDSLDVPSGILIRGDQGTTIQPLDGETASPIFWLENVEGTTIRDLDLRGRSFQNSQSAGHAGVWMVAAKRNHLDNLSFSDLGDSVDHYGGIHVLLEAEEFPLTGDGISRHNVIENSRFNDWDHLASFGIRFRTRWENHHIETPDDSVAVEENIVKNNVFRGFYQGVEIAGPRTTGNLIRGNTSVDALIVGVEADKGAQENVFVENTIHRVRAPGDTSISGMRDQGFLQCSGSTFEYELTAADNQFLRNVIFDVADPRYAGGILLSRTEDGVFEGNLVRSISGDTADGMVLRRTGLVGTYTIQDNLRESGLVQQTYIPATSCN